MSWLRRKQTRCSHCLDVAHIFCPSARHRAATCVWRTTTAGRRCTSRPARATWAWWSTSSTTGPPSTPRIATGTRPCATPFASGEPRKTQRLLCSGDKNCLFCLVLGTSKKEKIPSWPFNSSLGRFLSKHDDETSRRWLATRLGTEEVVRGEVTMEEKVLIDLRGLVIIILLISRIVSPHLRSFIYLFFAVVNISQRLIQPVFMWRVQTERFVSDSQTLRLVPSGCCPILTVAAASSDLPSLHPPPRRRDAGSGASTCRAACPR